MPTLSTLNMTTKIQRIRDPLHNLIAFDTDQFEQVLWKVVQTQPFQRLRRVKQLGFSELVYPGATHSRFAHSVGAFDTARRLVQIINRHIYSQGKRIRDHQMQVALAAALVHDVGHGMFSHAFEDVGKRLKQKIAPNDPEFKIANHELVCDWLIRNGPISAAFRELGSGFANDVADVISRKRVSNLYDAVVSSQFDADRLDYMQRDRLMAGVQNSGIDFVWLLNNLEVGEIPDGVDEQQLNRSILTFVLGPKAIHAAETYILSLFQLYQTLYFHKATRGAEKILTEILMRLHELVSDGLIANTGLPQEHPIIRFVKEPENIIHTLALDDTVLYGALPLLMEAKDKILSHYAARLWERRLLKCVDVIPEIVTLFGAFFDDLNADEHDSIKRKIVRQNAIKRAAVLVKESLEESGTSPSGELPRFLLDNYERHPYNPFEESKGPLNQIRIRRGDQIFDMAEISPIIASMEPFNLFRVYYDENDKDAPSFVMRKIEENVENVKKQIKGKK